MSTNFDRQGPAISCSLFTSLYSLSRTGATLYGAFQEF